MTVREKLKEKLLEKREISENGCWEWVGFKDPKGYGRITFRNRPLAVHRASFEIFRELIRGDGFVHHTCGNRHCFNPEHLELVDRKEHYHRIGSVGWNNGKKKL